MTRRFRRPSVTGERLGGVLDMAALEALHGGDALLVINGARHDAKVSTVPDGYSLVATSEPTPQPPAPREGEK